MTKDDRSAFAVAYEAASRSTAREGRKICHVRWKDGLLETTSRRIDGGEDEPRGWEPPPLSTRSTVRAEQGSLL